MKTRHGLSVLNAPVGSVGRITVGALLLLPFGYLTSSPWRLTPVPRLVASLLVSAVLDFVLATLAKRVWRWCTASIGATAIPTHQAADRELSLSYLESLIAGGNHEAAVEEIERMLAAFGLADVGLSRLAANYHLRIGGDAERGEALLRRMRSEHPETFETFATQRLIDLLMRDSITAMRAIPELHRLARRHPGTVEADGAAKAIVRLREQVRATEAGCP